MLRSTQNGRVEVFANRKIAELRAVQPAFTNAKFVRSKTAELRAVLEVGVPLQGVYINVHDQNGTDYDDEMRRKYVVLHPLKGFHDNFFHRLSP